MGRGTISNDNPSLTTRLVDGPNPQPVIVDSDLRCPLDCKLLTHSSCVRPIIFGIVQGGIEERQKKLESLGATVYLLEPASQMGGHGRVPLDAVFEKLFEVGYKSVMVEGGARILSSILECHRSMVDALVITIAPAFVGGLNAIKNPIVTTNDNLSRMCLQDTFVLESDIIACYGLKGLL